VSGQYKDIMEPLPLEDAPPLQPRRQLWTKWIFAFVCLVLAFGTFLGMRYRAGAVPEFAYAEFTVPDDSCKLLMIGAPVAGCIESLPGFNLFPYGESFSSSHWSTTVATGLRWFEIKPGNEAMIRPEDLFAAEIAQRAMLLNAKVVKEAAVKWNEYQGREAVFVNGRTRTVERYLFLTRPGKPRFYAISVGGSGLPADSEAVHKVFGSFRLK